MVSPLQILASIFGLLSVIHGSVLLDLGGVVLYLVVGSFRCQYGQEVLSDVHGVNLVLFETGFWDFLIYIRAI